MREEEQISSIIINNKTFKLTSMTKGRAKMDTLTAEKYPWKTPLYVYGYVFSLSIIFQNLVLKIAIVYLIFKNPSSS